MSLILVTKEQADEHSLMHYRTKGSRNGHRLYQYEDGSLTPLGRIHYGIGQARDKKKADASNKEHESDANAEEKYGKEFDEGVKAGKYDNDPELRELYIMEQQEIAREKAEKKPNLIDRVNERIEKKAEANRPETRKEERESEKELEKKIVGGIENFNERSKEAVKERTEKQEERSKNLQQMMKSIRNMTDEELNANIDRLQREKRYSDLLKEQDAREKGPIRTMVTKALTSAAEDLTKKSLTLVVDKLISKAKGEKKSFTLSDYKDVDLNSIDADKLAAVSQAFQNAANIATNKWKLAHPGQDPNQQNQQNQNNGGNQQKNNQNSGNQQKGQNSGDQQQSQNGELSKNQRKKIRSLAASGKSAAELAQQFGVSESTIRQYAGEQLRSQNDSSNNESESGSSGRSSDQASNSTSGSERSDSSQRDSAHENTPSQTSGNTRRTFSDMIRNNRQAMAAIRQDSRAIDERARQAETEERDRKFDEYARRLSGELWEQQKSQIRAEQEAAEAERRRREEEEERRRARERERRARNGLIV